MNEFGEVTNIFDLEENEIIEFMNCMLEWLTAEELAEELGIEL